MGNGDAVGRPGGRCDYIRNRFSLRQIHLSREKGPLGELSGFGHPDTGLQEKPQDLRNDEGGRVAGNLNGVLARIGMRRTENRNQHVVKELAFIGDTAVMEGIAL